MLYERWRQIAREFRAEMALRDFSGSEQWTFGEVADLAESGKALTDPISYPQDLSADFVFAVLTSWRDLKIVCPIEIGQRPPSVPQPPAGIIHLKTTSASTGAPRLAAFTAAQLVADADNIVQTMGLRPDWPNLGVISLAHSYGFSNLVLPLLLHGIPLVLVESPLPERVRAAAGAMPSITLAAVPALWRAWHEANAIPANVRLAISAGAPLPLALEADVFRRTGIKLHNFYGATECGGIAYDASDKPRADAACVGAALKNVRLSSSDEGCLEVRGAAVGQTYWPEPDSNLERGCYRSSDLAELTGGQVFLRGRLSDQINVAGRKVSPETIERVLLTHPSIRDCLVFGVTSADAGRSESIVASVVAHSSLTAEMLRQFLLPQLPAWQIPRDWWFVDSLAANERGKLPRAEWRKKYLEIKRAQPAN
jgi:acyl-CoA synthetase (AMP-forming)/AMP-acid ligase II